MLLVFGFYETTKKELKQICNYICRNYSYDHFLIRISLKFLVKTGLGALKSACKKVVIKIAKVTGEFIGNKIANIEEIVISPKKREEILNELR